jgi:hypothetical protein
VFRGGLDVPAELLRYVSRLLAAERRRRGTPARSSRLTCREQALLALRWFRDRTRIDRLATDCKISRATAYRYVAEAVDVKHRALEAGIGAQLGTFPVRLPYLDALSGGGLVGVGVCFGYRP